MKRLMRRIAVLGLIVGTTLFLPCPSDFAHGHPTTQQ